MKGRDVGIFGIGQQREKLQDLEEGARPAMDEKERDCVLAFGALMQKVNLQFFKIGNLNGDGEVRKAVQVLFRATPGEVLVPMIRESADISQG